MKKIILILFSMLAFFVARSQEYNKQAIDSIPSIQEKQKSSHTGFLLTGYGNASFISDKNSNTFGDLGFSPIFLWRPNEHFFFESELEMGFEDGQLKINLEYANINCVLNKYVTFRFGKFLSPFGTFGNLYHPSWINKIPFFPLGFGDGGIGPMSEFGAALSGGIPLGSSKINYNLYVSNGPTLNLGDKKSGEEGNLMYENITDNNKNKAIGGRLGFLPFLNSSFELGASFQSAKVGDAGSQYENVKALLYAFDFNYVKQLDFLKGTIDAKAQWNFVNVDKANYINHDDSTGKTLYTYDNKRDVYYAQLAYRPTMLQNKVMKKFEAVIRYSALNLPANAKDNKDVTQVIYGLNYWVNWRTVVKVAYKPDKVTPRFWLQLAMGF
jgi:hypothetical protein